MDRWRSSARIRTSVLAMMVAVTTVIAVPAAGQEDLTVPADAVDSIVTAKTVRTYMVIMADDPIVAYEGGEAGLAATKPADGEKVDPANGAVRAYENHLKNKHDRALTDAGVATNKKVYDFAYSLNGFAADLTGAEATELAKQEGVLAVIENEIRHMDTVSTPEFLGLTDKRGAWDRGYVGEDVIVGVIDSGIWPENLAFSDTFKPKKNKNDKDTRKPKSTYKRIRGWDGACETGEEFEASDCNNKLIGARFYAEGFGGEAGIRADFPYEFFSPRDYDGHGTHTASTAGGNRGVPVVIDGYDFGTMSGMAPRARIAAYKVCWGTGEEGGCSTVDSVAAIDQAVADGVDVINYSISGTSTNLLDPVEVAFLFAADAGVVVNASAGNDGPGASTVAHPSPWITTVAAGTHDRASFADVLTGDGATYSGASLNETGTDVLSLVYSGDVGLAGADPTEVELCYPGTLDPALVAGKMVLCDRGVIARVDKSAAVAEADGLAMILGNVAPNSINADLHTVPSVHVDEVARAAILAYIQSAGDAATGQLSAAVASSDPNAPEVASFSSRGPLLATSDLLKPDIMAPGQDIIAAVSPAGHGGRDFDFLSGTSMSSPHMAGMSAVMRDAHPRWSPAAIKSALMTTADDVSAATPFDVGSGHVDINQALDPGLVYDAGFDDYFAFLCGTGQLTGCDEDAIDPSDLNQPNITIGELAGSQTVTRTVTNVDKNGTYRVSVDAPPGIEVTVSPSTLRLKKNRSATYEVTFTATDAAALGEYAFGSLTWSDRKHEVNSDLTVRPVQLAAPAEVIESGVTGSGSIDVTFGYTGAYTAAAHGFVPATTQDGNVVDDPANDINAALASGVGITIHAVTVPEGAAYTRISLFDDETDGADDLDLYVFAGDGSFLAGSGSGTSAEQVDLAGLPAGTYLAVVHGWQTDGPDANYTLFDWTVLADPEADDGSLVIDGAPASAEVGVSGSVDYSWTGLSEGVRYLGAISHSDGAGTIGLTVVGIGAS